jgi:hypothetical protein
VCVRAVHSHESIIFFCCCVSRRRAPRTFMSFRGQNANENQKLRFKRRALTAHPTNYFLYLQRSLCCVAAAAAKSVIACVRRRFVLCARLINYKKMCHAWHQMTNVLCSVLASDGSRTRHFTMCSLLISRKFCRGHSTLEIGHVLLLFSLFQKRKFSIFLLFFCEALIAVLNNTQTSTQTNLKYAGISSLAILMQDYQRRNNICI